MIRSALRALASQFAEDPNLTKFTAAQYNEALNRAQEEFAFDSLCLFGDASTFTVVDGTATYNLPSDFFMEKLITHKGLELQPITRDALVAANGDDWTDDEGTPTNYIIDPEEGKKKITLYPIPGADDAGANLILTYYKVPGEMSTDSEKPLNDSVLLQPFHIGISARAAEFLLLYRTQTPEILMKRKELFGLYNQKVTQAVDRFGTTKRASFRMKGCNG